MLSHAVRILQEETMFQIEIGRQRDPKDSGGEGRDAHKLVHTQKSVFYVFYIVTDSFAHRSFYAEKPLHRGVFLHKNLSTQKLLHTQKLLYKEGVTRRASTHGHVYSQKLLHREAFTERACTHGNFYTHRNLYIQTRFHT